MWLVKTWEEWLELVRRLQRLTVKIPLYQWTDEGFMFHV